MLTVKRLADLADVTNDTVRYYTRLGMLEPTRHPDNNYKLYSNADSKRLRFIVSAKRIGFSLTEIQQLLDNAKSGETPCPQARDVIQRRIHDNRHAMASLQHLQQSLERALTEWEKLPNRIPDGNNLCNLIENWDQGLS